MPRDSNGDYTRAVAAYVNGNVADADDVNDEMDDIGAELSASLEASGKKTWTGNQNANGYGIRSLLNTKVHTTGGGTTAYTVTTGASLTSYATMPLLFVKANATNTGSMTINVDSIGALTVKKNGATNLASGDFVQDYVYALAYDGTNLQLIGGALATIYQPLDATLTALAALSTSADQLIKATGADTFAMTGLTADAALLLADADVPRLGTVNTWAAAQTFGAVSLGPNGANTAPAWSFANDTDSGFFLNADGQLGWSTAGTTRMTLSTALVVTVPVRGSGGSVGAPAFQVSSSDTDNGFYYIGTNNFGASVGGSKIVDFLTTGIDVTGLVQGTTLRGRAVASTETTGTLTSASANKTIQLTGDIQIDNSVFAAGDIIVVYAGASARTITQGSGVTMRLDGTSTTGSRSLAARGMAFLFFVSASEVIVGGKGVT